MHQQQRISTTRIYISHPFLLFPPTLLNASPNTKHNKRKQQKATNQKPTNQTTIKQHPKRKQPKGNKQITFLSLTSPQKNTPPQPPSPPVSREVFWSEEVARKIEQDFRALPEAPKHDQATSVWFSRGEKGGKGISFCKAS